MKGATPSSVALLLVGQAQQTMTNEQNAGKKIIMKKEILEYALTINRRKFLSRLGLGIGGVALGSLLIPDLFGGSEEEMVMTGLPHFAPKEWRPVTIRPV